MISRNKKLLALGLAAPAVAAAAFAAVVFGGAVTVAATDPHFAPVKWMLETTMESSVRTHAADVEVPEGLDLHDPALAERAFGHYSVACTPCHGAPGIDPAPWLLLNPPADLLVETASQWSDAELYWIVKHGIKMTGMPALGPTHGDDDLWAIAAFVRQLPEMSAETYQAMANRHHARHGEAMGSSAAPEEPTAPAPDPVPQEAAETNVKERSGGAEPEPASPREPEPPRVRGKVKSAPARAPNVVPTPSASAPEAAPAPSHEHHGGHAHG